MKKTPAPKRDIITPNSIDAEQALISALMNLPHSHSDILSAISPVDFFGAENRNAFLVMCDLINRNEVNVVSFSQEWKRRYPGIVFPAVEVFDSAAAFAYPAMIREVKDLTRRRALLEVIGESQQRLMGAEKTDAIAADLIAKITQSGSSIIKKPESMENVIKLSMKHIEQAMESKIPAGLPTGFRAFDDQGGLYPGDLILVGARPSEGKSAWASSVALNAALQGRHAMIVNAEMTLKDVGIRLLARESNIANFDLRRGVIPDEELANLTAAEGRLAPLPIWIYDDTRWEVIKTQIRALHARNPLSIVLIDYVTLIDAEGDKDEQRYQKIGRIGKDAKKLAVELNIPIVLLAQISREVAKASREPELTDLRESGDLEQDADAVIFLHREVPKERWWAWMIVKKNRNGPMCRLKLRYVEHRVAYYDWNEE